MNPQFCEFATWKKKQVTSEVRAELSNKNTVCRQSFGMEKYFVLFRLPGKVYQSNGTLVACIFLVQRKEMGSAERERQVTGTARSGSRKFGGGGV